MRCCWSVWLSGPWRETPRKPPGLGWGGGGCPEDSGGNVNDTGLRAPLFREREAKCSLPGGGGRVIEGSGECSRYPADLREASELPPGHLQVRLARPAPRGATLPLLLPLSPWFQLLICWAGF